MSEETVMIVDEAAETESTAAPAVEAAEKPAAEGTKEFKDPVGRVECKICGKPVHSIMLHLRDDHKDLNMSLADYEAKFPGAPVLSALAASKVRERVGDTAAAGAVAAPSGTEPNFFHSVFGLGTSKAAMNSHGAPIPVTVLDRASQTQELIPAVDSNYIFNIEVLKSLMVALEMNIPAYLWGHAGTGKTTIFEQIAARTSRAMMRVQHTANTEEEHILGGWRLRDGRTLFELGPLPLAMRHGWLYIADEYDFARPEVSAVYQAVLEGKPLIIKEADAENRVIQPHKNFRIVATGNTNGQGDEHGLYNGTLVQNAANYERFGVVEQMPYMDKKVEARVIAAQARIAIEDATKLVEFADSVRKEFSSAKISNPISPRSLIYAARIGVARASYRIGLEKAFLNRLSSVDKETCSQFAQRVFG